MENSNSWTKQAKRKNKKQWANDRINKKELKRQRIERLEKIDKGEFVPETNWENSKTHVLGNPNFDKYYAL